VQVPALRKACEICALRFAYNYLLGYTAVSLLPASSFGVSEHAKFCLVSSLAYCSALKIEIICSTETSALKIEVICSTETSALKIEVICSTETSVEALYSRRLHSSILPTILTIHRPVSSERR
jgi:hypothetical protein